MSAIFDYPSWISSQKNSWLNKVKMNNYLIHQLELTFHEPRFEKNQPEVLPIILAFSCSQFLYSAVNIHIADFIWFF